jgi:acetyltransferase-like isoleucine patch superfamily enzyme
MKKIVNYLKYKLNKFIHPEIIGGFRNSDGVFHKLTRISNLSHLSNKSNLDIADNVFVGHFNYIDGHEKVVIQEGAQITNHISVLTHSSHHGIRIYGKEYCNVAQKDEFGVIKTGEIFIGAYTFIGPHSTIMPGTRIGKGCIVGAYSFVQGKFPDYSIIKGQPAKIVGNTKDVDKELIANKNNIANTYYEQL